MTTSAVIFVIYLLFAIIAIGYVVVNVFHLIRFRLPLRGDLSLLILFFYLLAVVGVLVGSIMLGFIAFKI